MSLRIEYPAREVPPGGLVADRRLCADKGWTTLLEETSPDVAFLLAAKGQPIAADVVKRMSLRLVDGRVIQGPEPLEGIVHPAGAMPEPKVTRKARVTTKPKE